MSHGSKFKIKFRGTRGSYPTPKENFLNFGGNTSCVEVLCGKQLIILDAGTGIIDVGNDVVKNSILNNLNSLNNKDFKNENIAHQATILLSHIHQDHIQGLQFYKPLFNPKAKINIFGLVNSGENLKDTLKTILFDKVFPLSLDEIKSNLEIHNFQGEDVVVISQEGAIKRYSTFDKPKIQKNDIKITTCKTMAHPKSGSLSIKIEFNNKTLVYATDKESYVGSDKKFIQFAYGCDCLIHDAQYTYDDYANAISPKQGFGHSTFEMAIETKELAKAKRLFFFHYDPEYDDNKLKMLEEEFKKGDEIAFAKENLEIEL